MECRKVTSDLGATLPESLIEEILGKLPYSSLVRLCTVCKRWRDSILYSGIFQRCSSDEGCLFYFSKGKPMILSASTRTWEPVPLHFLEENQSRLLNVAMSAGGLICFRIVGAWDFIVCNPLTKSYKRLQLPRDAVTVTDPAEPVCLAHSPLALSSLVGMVVDGDTGHFKVIVGGFLYQHSEGTTVVYNSCADSWKKTTTFPQDLKGEVTEKWQPTAWKGNLYFYYARRHMSERFVKYDVVKQAWSLILMPTYMGIPRSLVQYDGKLLLMTPMYLARPKHVMMFKELEVQDAGNYGGSVLWLPTDHWTLSRVRPVVPLETHIECLGHGQVMFLTMRSTTFRDLCFGYPKKTSVIGLFHNVATNSNPIPNWEDMGFFRGYEESPDLQIFMPSTILLK